MARLARVVLPGLPHHVTQRGNGRQQTFFNDVDYALYRDLLREHCARAGVAVWSWMLMPNHVHLVLVPSDEDGLRRALAPLHRGYAGRIHERMQRTGHFWQGRFGCVAMDEGACPRGDPLWPDEPRAGAASGTRHRLALVEHPRVAWRA